MRCVVKGLFRDLKIWGHVIGTFAMWKLSPTQLILSIYMLNLETPKKLLKQLFFLIVWPVGMQLIPIGWISQTMGKHRVWLPDSVMCVSHWGHQSSCQWHDGVVNTIKTGKEQWKSVLCDLGNVLNLRNHRRYKDSKVVTVPSVFLMMSWCFLKQKSTPVFVANGQHSQESPKQWPGRAWGVAP